MRGLQDSLAYAHEQAFVLPSEQWRTPLQPPHVTVPPFPSSHGSLCGSPPFTQQVWEPWMQGPQKSWLQVAGITDRSPEAV